MSQLESLTRHLWGLLVLGQQFLETTCVTFGFGDHSRLVGLGFFELALRAAAGFRNHAVGIGIGLFFETQLVFLGLDHVIEGRLDLGRWLGFLDIDLDDLDARAVTVEIALQT